MSKRINQQELLELLMKVERSTFIHLVTETPVKMNKTGNPFFEKVIKKNSGNFLIGNGYQDRVRTNEGKEGLEGTFESVENTQGEHLTKCVLFNEKLNTYYLQYEYFLESNPKTEYVFEGNVIDKTLFESYLIKKSTTSRQVQERKTFFQSYKLTNIKKMTLNGEKYEIV